MGMDFKALKKNVNWAYYHMISGLGNQKPPEWCRVT